MALKALVCPQCGANLSLDDSRDFGFCQFCGTKVMLHETVEVKHTGSVKIDNSDQERNFLQLANSSFNSLNFEEAYMYYTRTLELNANNVLAVYMKGICAVYNSDPQAIRTNEYVQAIKQATSMAVSAGNGSSDQLIKGIEDQSSAMMNYWFNNGLPIQPATNEQGECISEFSKAVNVANLAQNVVQLIFSEEGKEELINQAIPFIDTTLKTKLKYFAGIQTDKKGRQTPVYKPITATSEQQKMLNTIRDYLRDTFNNLPSRVARSSDINDRLNAADEEKNRIKSQLKDLKSQRNSLLFTLLKDRKNPEIKAQIAALDADIKVIESQLGDAKSVSKGISGEMKEFRKTLK